VPLTHATVVYDVNDAKVYPMLTDAVGASPTYGASVDVPGITEVSAEPNLVTAELKGDATVIAKKGRTDRINVSATYGKLSLDALKVLQGGVTGDTAETRSAYRLAGPAPLPYFKLEFQVQDLDIGLGSLVVVLYKCQITGGTLINTSSDSFNQPSFTAEALAIDGTLPANTNSIVAATVSAMMDVVFNSTVVALSA
jgi:hypothetical protein